MTAGAALARTTRLINHEFFDGNAEEAVVAAGLTATTVRLIADSRNMAGRGGQAALVTAFQLIARMGIRIDLIAPETELVAIVPPLRQPTLRAALLDLSTDLIPNATLLPITGSRRTQLLSLATPNARRATPSA